MRSGLVRLSMLAFLLLGVGRALPAEEGEISSAAVSAWLSGYGSAWETRDPEAAASLFAENATYRDNPYAEPYVGRAGIRKYWADVTADQRDVSFQSQILGTAGRRAFVHWSASFTTASTGDSVSLDGIFVLEFDEGGLCSSLKEWWHVNVTKAAPGKT